MTHLKRVCTDFDLDGKVACVIADGDATVQSAASKLCAYLVEEKGNEHRPQRIVCGAHLMSRCINDLIGTKTQNRTEVGNEFNFILKLASATVSSIRNVERIARKYDELQTGSGHLSKKPPLPCITGAAFDEFLKHKPALRRKSTCDSS